MSEFFWLKTLVAFPFCILKRADIICALCFQCSIIENALMYNLKQYQQYVHKNIYRIVLK